MMRTVQRLTVAYKNAKVEWFDENSKYVFLSDCHRGDGSLSDEFTKNENTYLTALEYYYNNGFTYVEVGDGDELWEHSEFKHIKNAHADVFSLMEKFFHKDRLILIYGNHNAFLKNPKYVEKSYHINYDEYTEEFNEFLKGIKPEEAIVLKNKKTLQEILVVHGHQGDFPNDQIWRLSMFSMKYFWRFLHAFGIKNPGSPIKNIHKRHKIEKNYSKWIRKSKIMLICGHTHRFKYPKPGGPPYFNTGCCVYPAAISAVEITGGEIQLVRWEVRGDQDGSLKVIRDVMRGPEPVEKFDIRDTI